MGSLVSVIVVDQGVVNSTELGKVAASGMSTITSRFSPLNPQQSPVSMSSYHRFPSSHQRHTRCRSVPGTYARPLTG